MENTNMKPNATITLSITSCLDCIYALEALRIHTEAAAIPAIPLGRSNDKALRALARKIFAGLAVALAQTLDVAGIQNNRDENDDIIGISVSWPGSPPSTEATAMMREHLESALGFGVLQAAWAISDHERSSAFARMYQQCISRFAALFPRDFPSRIKPD